MAITRGVRNNNPLNIRLTRDKWVGLCKEQTDKEFCQFTDPLFGFRAAFRIIHNQFKKVFQTIQSIVYRWAPPSENNSAAYALFVARKVGCSHLDVLDYDDVELMVLIVQSMAYYETHVWYDYDLIKQAYYMERGK